MNIMLVFRLGRDARDRIRRAVGARRSAVLLPILAGARRAQLAGGAIGLGVGVGDWRRLVQLIGGFNAVVSAGSDALARASRRHRSLFGSLSGDQAARLSPIEALRYE